MNHDPRNCPNWQYLDHYKLKPFTAEEIENECDCGVYFSSDSNATHLPRLLVPGDFLDSNIHGIRIRVTVVAHRVFDGVEHFVVHYGIWDKRESTTKTRCGAFCCEVLCFCLHETLDLLLDTIR